MSEMFLDCSSLKFVNLSTFNPKNCNTMDSMFKNCKSLTSINLKLFSTDSLTNMDYMFSSCTSLKSIHWVYINTLKCPSFKEVFENDDGLELYLYPNNCQNLITSLPNYVKFHRNYDFQED